MFSRKKSVSSKSKIQDSISSEQVIVDTQIIHDSSLALDVAHSNGHMSPAASNSPQLQACTRETFKTNYIFWFNNCLQQLYRENLDICTVLTQRQLSRDINQKITKLIHASTEGIAVATIAALFTNPKGSLADHPKTANVITRTRINHFTPLLNFYIRFARTFNLEQLMLADNSLDPLVCFNLLGTTLSESALPKRSQRTLAIRFAEVMETNYDRLMGESNMALIKPNTEYSQTESEDCANSTSNEDNGIRDHREEMAAKGSHLTEQAFTIVTDAIREIISETPIPIRIHPLVQEWEKYLFKLYVTKGSDSSDWSRALRSLVSIRNLTQLDNPYENKQVQLDCLTDTMASCREELSTNLLTSDQIDSLLQPFEELVVMSVYNNDLEEVYKKYEPSS